MERTVLEESWRRNGPVGPSLEVIDDDDDDDIMYFLKYPAYGKMFQFPSINKVYVLCWVLICFLYAQRLMSN
jgi:hypothetical protein